MRPRLPRLSQVGLSGLGQAVAANIPDKQQDDLSRRANIGFGQALCLASRASEKDRKEMAA